MADSRATRAGAGARPTAPVRQVAAVVAGNALEFYDFLTYAYFAVQIGRSFFPSADPSSSLLASLATFGVGFVGRPVGAWVIGRLGDRRGRKPAMLLSFGLMGLGMIGLALTPGYARIGALAPVLAVTWRLVQGFALGGEVGPSTAFLAEASSPERRGLFTSFQMSSQRMAALAAGLMGIALSHNLSPAALDAWGWRVAFLAGAAIIPVGLMLRNSVAETLERAPEAQPAHTGPPVVRIASIAPVILAGGTIGSYVIDYLTTYATVTLHMGSQVAFYAPLASGITGTIVAPIAGWASDRIGRRPIMLGSWAVMLIGAMPMFLLLEHSRSALALILLAGGLTACVAAMFGAGLTAIGEALPMRMRSGGLGLIYGLTISVFGGSTQYVVAWLTHQTHNTLTPAWYLTVAVAVSLLATLAFPETAPARTAGRQDTRSSARIPA